MYKELSIQITTAPQTTEKIRSQHFTPGLALPAFNDDFDLYFQVKSDFLIDALSGKDLPGDAGERCRPVQMFKDNPSYWGLRVRTLESLWRYVQADAEGYAAAHQIDGNFRHICRATPCSWHHHNADLVVTEANAAGPLQPMKVNMHLINGRYIRPWTEAFHKAGLSLVLNTARLCDRPGPSAEEICFAQIFISHCWEELSPAFFGTLYRDFDPDRVLWICSFALWQHGVSDIIKDVEMSPFFKALQTTRSVTAVTDVSCQVFDRVWCVLESHLALDLQKPFELVLWEDEDHSVWHTAAEKLASVDVHQCSATKAADKDMILEFTGPRLREVNQHLNEISQGAVLKAKIRSYAKDGMLGDILKNISIDELRAWKTSKRQRNLTHLFAVNSHVSAMLEFSKLIDHAQLESMDIDGRTPLSLACEVGEAATVTSLLSLRANLDHQAHTGLTALHYAAEYGHRSVALLLIHSRANIDARGTFRREKSHTPLSVAVSCGMPDLVRDLLLLKCDCNMKAAELPLLQIASKWGFSQIVASLVSSEAEIDATDENGKTALMHATQQGHADVVALLMSAGADLAMRDADRLTVYDYCNECRRDQPAEANEITFFLKKFNAKAVRSPVLQSKLATTETLKAYFRRFDTNADGKMDRHQLQTHMDAHGWSVEEVDQLIKHFDIDESGRFDYEDFVNWLMLPSGR